MCLIPSLESRPGAFRKQCKSRPVHQAPASLCVPKSRCTERAWLMEHEHKQRGEVSWIEWCPTPSKTCLPPNSRNLWILPYLEKGTLLSDWGQALEMKRLSWMTQKSPKCQGNPTNTTASGSWCLSPRASGGGGANLPTSWFRTPASRTVRE